MIEELISKVFWTRNLAHVAHWATSSYSQHMALGSFYDTIVDDLDAIVEAYQGKHGLVKPYIVDQKVPKDFIEYLESEAEWINSSKNSIAGNCGAIANLIDNLTGTYLSTLYKLKNLS